MPIPDLQSGPTYDGQAVQDSTDLAATSAVASGTGIISGCVVSALASPTMAVQVSNGVIQVGGSAVASVAGSSSLTINAASTSDRRDIAVSNSSGTLSIVQGTPCGTAGWTRSSGTLPPVKPAIPANSVFLADIYVPAGATSIANANIEANSTRLNAGPILVTPGVSGGGGIQIQFDGAFAESTNQAFEVFDSLGAPIFNIASYGGAAVYSDKLSAAVGVFGLSISLDATTNPPSLLLPSGNRIWNGAGLPSTVINFGTAAVNDLYYDGANALWYICTVSGTPGTWVVSGLAQIEALFTAAGQLIVGTGAGTGELLTAGSVGTVLTSNGSASIPSWQPSSGGGASAGVSSFNTRSGAVTLGAADVEATFGAAGQLFMGIGSGTGELLAPASTAGLVLTSAGTGSNLVWQSASVASGLSTIYASDHSSQFTQSNASVNVHTGVGVFVDALGADPTGVADSTAAFNAALTAAASVGYVRLGVGTYLIGTTQTTTTTTTGNLSASCPATFVMASTTGMYNGYGTFDVVTSNGVGVVQYTGISGASVTGCTYGGLGGTGSISSGASVTIDVGAFTHGLGLIGPGSELTTINYNGPGIGIHMADKTYTASVSVAAPAIGFSLVGTSSGLSGFNFRNLSYARVHDLNISGFTNANSGAGFTIGANSGGGTWTSCVATNNTDAVLVGGLQNLTDYDFTITANANQNGFIAYSNSSLTACHLRIKGTFNTGASSNTGIALQVGGSGSDTTQLAGSTFDISMRTSGSGVAHQSLSMNVNSAAFGGMYGTGTVNFSTGAGATAFTAATGFSGVFAVSGCINVPGIGAMTADALGVAGGSLWQSAGTATASPASGDIYLNNGDLQIWQLASGANTWTFELGPSSSLYFGKQITLIAVQPSSGSAGTLTWPGNVVWASGAAPILSSANNAVDKFRLTYLPQTNTWYGAYETGSASDRGGRVATITANTATPSINTDTASYVHITGQSTTITSFTTNLQGHPQDGFELRISITGTTSVGITSWGSSFESSTVPLPTTTSGANRMDIAFVWNTETAKWRCVGVA